MVPFALVADEPDLGTSLSFPIILIAMYFWAGMPVGNLVLGLSPGFTLVRPLSVMGHRTGPGHWEVRFDGCRVPVQNTLGERGQGFALAQTRLGPGHIHHCMRWVGQAQYAFERMCAYAKERSAFGQWRDRIFTVRDSRWRLVWNPEGIEPNDTPVGRYPIPERALFDARSDPRELEDVAARNPEVVERLLAEIERWRAGLAPCSELRAPDPDRAKAMHDLGYGEGEPPR